MISGLRSVGSLECLSRNNPTTVFGQRRGIPYAALLLFLRLLLLRLRRDWYAGPSGVRCWRLPCLTLLLLQLQLPLLHLLQHLLGSFHSRLVGSGRGLFRLGRGLILGVVGVVVGSIGVWSVGCGSQING